MTAIDGLHPALAHHIVNTLGWPELRPLQNEAAAPLLAGHHALLIAPTAGGKTEAAFFPLLSRMLTEDWRGLSLLYVCPIKALLNNLQPRLHHYADLVGRRADVWHGDVSAGRKRGLRADQPDVLLTTPESIEVMLDSRSGARTKIFGGLRAVIIDELHAFAGDDRGWHLLSVLERAGRIAGREIQRVGLSATIGNPEDLLGWLAGHVLGPRRVVSPPPDNLTVPEVALDHVASMANAATVISRLHHGEKRLVFCDSRARVEQLAALLRGASVTTFVSHSSLSLDERRQAESAFSDGENCVIVATSTLELGIDVGDLDRVIQIDAPSSVASFLQRLGRTGRRKGTSRNCLYLTTTDDAFGRAAGLLRLWSQGYVEPITPPPDPFHLLSHQIMALALQEGGVREDGWREWVGRVPAFGRMEPREIAAVLRHMLEQGILHADGGLLWFGDAGERAFGRKNFMELFSVFTSPPLFTVLHGREDIGVVHPSSFQTRKNEPPVLLLGGRSWLVTHVDWRSRTAHVRPTEGPGRSRWLGTSQALHFRHCRSIRSVLAGADPGVTLKKRASQKLEELRTEFAWVKENATSLVRDGAGELRWWTFAGLRANATITEHLGALRAESGHVDNLSVSLRSTGGIEELLERRAALVGSRLRPAVQDEALDALKFSECLPLDLAERALSPRLVDDVAVEACLSEAIVQVTCE